MKKKYVLFSALILTTCLVRGQAPSGQGVAPSGQAGSISGQTAGQRQVGQGQPRNGIPGQNPTGQTIQNGNVSNQSSNNNINTTRPNGIGANQVNPDRRVLLPNQNRPVFGGTNQVTFGTTNRPFGTTNQVAFGGTNGAVPFGTNAGPSPIAGNGTIINDASGAAAVNQNGTVLPPVSANGVAGIPNANGQHVSDTQTLSNGEEVFNQRLRSSLLQTGATRIYFPQTRSTVTVANQKGTVTLSGQVANEAERQQIESRIRKTQGVTTVNNQLQVLGSRTTGTNLLTTPNNDAGVRFP
ncbi:MAG: BON domain-containing protein [Verrucomicrobiota bacterium]